jgi:hypothetical protein
VRLNQIVNHENGWSRHFRIRKVLNYQFGEHGRLLVTACPREYHRLEIVRPIFRGTLLLFLEYLAIAVQVHVEGYFGVRLQKLLQVLNLHFWQSSCTRIDCWARVIFICRSIRGWKLVWCKYLSHDLLLHVHCHSKFLLASTPWHSFPTLRFLVLRQKRSWYNLLLLIITSYQCFYKLSSCFFRINDYW